MQRAWVSAALAAAVLTGCGDGAAGAPAATETVHSKSRAAAGTSDATTVPTPASPSPSATEILNYDSGLPADVPEPVWDDASRAAATQTAAAAMTAFARPDLPYEQWWTDLAPHLSVQAQLDYQYVDPSYVPARAVTGQAGAPAGASASVVQIPVPTDVGAYTVVLSRTGAAAPWLVERFTPPEGVG